jgi:hypothetical protein
VIDAPTCPCEVLKDVVMAAPSAKHAVDARKVVCLFISLLVFLYRPAQFNLSFHVATSFLSESDTHKPYYKGSLIIMNIAYSTNEPILQKIREKIVEVNSRS